jgi:hypothetical protein
MTPRSPSPPRFSAPYNQQQNDQNSFIYLPKPSRPVYSTGYPAYDQYSHPYGPVYPTTSGNIEGSQRTYYPPYPPNSLTYTTYPNNPASPTQQNYFFPSTQITSNQLSYSSISPTTNIIEAYPTFQSTALPPPNTMYNYTRAFSYPQPHSSELESSHLRYEDTGQTTTNST